MADLKGKLYFSRIGLVGSVGVFIVGIGYAIQSNVSILTQIGCGVAISVFPIAVGIVLVRNIIEIKRLMIKREKERKIYDRCLGTIGILEGFAFSSNIVSKKKATSFYVSNLYGELELNRKNITRMLEIEKEAMSLYNQLVKEEIVNRSKNVFHINAYREGNKIRRRAN